jgi:hypothetical protein
MIQFRQKQFTEYDAMKTLYEKILRKTGGDKNKRFKIINKSQLIPILKTNSVVVEKFTISTSMFGRDKYRMYIKIGAKAKLPDEVRLPELKEHIKTVGNFNINLKGGLLGKKFSEMPAQKEFGKGGGGGNNNPGPVLGTELSKRINITRKVQEILGEAIEYSKTQRSLVLEFTSVDDAIEALNYLPFGLNYQIYLLDA